MAELLKACCKAGLTAASLLADFHLLLLYNDPGAQRGCFLFWFWFWFNLFLFFHGYSLRTVQLNLKHPNKIKKSNPLFFFVKKPRKAIRSRSVGLAYYLFIPLLLINSRCNQIFFQKQESHLGMAVEQGTVARVWVG